MSTTQIRMSWAELLSREPSVQTWGPYNGHLHVVLDLMSINVQAGTEFDQVKGYVPWKRGVALVKVKILCRVIKVLK